MDIDLNKMQQMLSQARDMQSQLDERLATTMLEADAGGGAVIARMSGKKELLKLTIAPAAAGDLTMLEDLIVAAVNAAARKVDDAHKTATASMLGGLNLPGL